MRWRTPTTTTIDLMNIGAAAKASGISAKMIRHYESIGLIAKVGRSDAGYRRYGSEDVARLRFIRHARDAGFSTPDIARLLSLWRDDGRTSAEVKRLAQRHLQELHERIGELHAIAGALAHLVEHCQGDARPSCPILDALARPDALAPRTAASPAPRRLRARGV